MSEKSGAEFAGEYFGNKSGLTFVDIGANDGVTWSNSYFLEKNLGWNGFCIEPHPTMFKTLLQKRSCSCLNLAVSDKEGDLDFLSIEGSWEANMLSGLIENYDPRHRERIESEYRRYGGVASVVKVRTLPFSKIALDNNITNIDYMSIDTEGSELNVLHSIDFSKSNVGLFSVEVNYELDPLKEFLEPYGYKYLTKIACDVFFGK